MPIVITSIKVTLRLPIAVHRAVRNAAKEFWAISKHRDYGTFESVTRQSVFERKKGG